MIHCIPRQVKDVLAQQILLSDVLFSLLLAVSGSTFLACSHAGTHPSRPLVSSAVAFSDTTRSLVTSFDFIILIRTKASKPNNQRRRSYARQ